ncbi:uncharacterized protein FYW47_013810 [Aplochiton taeniatus]
MNTTPAVPPIKAARDFYGQKPPGYPYTCSLCHTTAYTETYWVGHVNEQRHSDGQLQLLQKFPDWDCRIETVRKIVLLLPGYKYSVQALVRAYGAEHTSEVTPILLPEKFGPEEYPLQTSMDLSELSDPVGTEFVRPVVGFFCNLCKVIYADEDEAKQKHCRSLSHFKKFKEHSSKEAKSSS